MPIHSRIVLGLVIGMGVLMIAILGFHLGNEVIFKIGDYSPLVGAFTGGILVLICTNIPISLAESTEPWRKRERIAWNLIGCGCLAWAFGECFWRYYLSQGQSPFPSLADCGYSLLPPLCFAGLMLQPFSKSSRRRLFLALDSLIAMGALLSIAWFLLLGSLAAAANETVLAKFLGLYYPVADIALLSCIIFLLLGGPNSFYQARARRMGLLIVGIGLAIFALSDFLFNFEQNLGTFVEESWSSLGWPLGMMTIGIAAYFRRFLPSATDEMVEERSEQEGQRMRFGLFQLLPYILLGVLFCVLVFNVLSTTADQQSIRPVLLLSTVIVTGLVVVRQIITMLENERLMRKQSTTLKQLEMVYQDIEKRQNALEMGVTHLKDVQTRLANGDVGARVQSVSNDLWPLAAGLNLMADRLMRAEHIQKNAQKLSRAINDLDQALKRKRDGGPFVLPLSCVDIPEMHGLIWTLGLGSGTGATQPGQSPSQPQQSQVAGSSATFAETSPPFSRPRPPAQSVRERKASDTARRRPPPRLP